ncbi:cobalt-precorrin-3B C(17)-methyltransferase [Ruminiclostridium hungatei]|uniref:Cobalt-precorrin-3B C(17)-methyltransferase n=1 Tax=Ruminiclostridium hungatei TaxID=48256 RepID=A0A1V4SQK0_RUMHU|nr:precorrin-3B C(17)-methyltransferase [Ruminiclostridium hungatei]OPX45736.1 cobalt-precorrin-3B C(17)-methyltransferase [Ruminiclostridium hungatei]
MKLYIIGTGPGEASQLTEKALEALSRSELIVGYQVYIDLIKPLIGEKETFTTPMRKEVERCKYAVEAAAAGRTVAVVSSGDAGVYGMAGLVFEILEAVGYNHIQVEVIPGITAATSAAAVLGAPLTHDFAVISLSDLLTPWEDIEKRLRLAAQAGFAICIYNPSSKKRGDYLKKACEIIMKEASGDTPCGYVRNIGRQGQTGKILTLRELAKEQVDMFTTVIVGNRNTRVMGNKLVTARGYKDVE